MFENSNIERTVDVRCEFFIFGYGFCTRSVNRGHFVMGRQVGEEKRICKTFAVLVLDAGDQYILTTITVMAEKSSPDIDTFTIRLFLKFFFR